jgi:hypothetical protein
MPQRGLQGPCPPTAITNPEHASTRGVERGQHSVFISRFRSPMHNNGRRLTRRPCTACTAKPLTLRAQYLFELVRNWAMCPRSFRPRIGSDQPA